MIYLNPCVQKSKKRSDGSYVGYICLTRERQMYMYNTGIILKSNEVTKNLSIRSCRSLNLLMRSWLSSKQESMILRLGT